MELLPPPHVLRDVRGASAVALGGADLPRLLSAAARAPQLPARPGPVLRRRRRLLLRGPPAARQSRVRGADLSHVRRAGLRRLVPSVYIEFCLYYRLEGDTGGVRGFDSASTRDGRPVLFRELMSVISSWYSSRSESAWRSFSWQLRVSSRSSSLSAASTAFARRGVRARRLGPAAAARLLEVPPNRPARSSACARAQARPRRGGAALEVRPRGAPPRLRALVRLLDRQKLLDELRHAPLLGGAQVRERAALRRRRRRRLGARGRDDLGEGGHAGFRSVGSRVDLVTLMARSGFSA